MMHDGIDDDELLRLAAAGSREAMARIARRYAGFVYHCALRTLRDPHAAADVAQTVFVILAGKVGRLRRGTVLHAWLFTTTRFAAANARKLQIRRTHHERSAAAMRHETVQSHDSDTRPVVALLDEALADLREADRAAVLLSYFGGRTFAQVGAATGKSEEAARKCVSRAVERMRAFFARRGIEVAVSALVVAMQSDAHASVPPHVMRAIDVGLARAPASVGSHALRLVTRRLAVACLGVAAAGVAGGLLATTVMVAPMQPAARPQQQAHAASTAPATGSASARFSNGVRVELLGVAAVPSETNGWWDPSGRRVAPPVDEAENPPEGAEYQAAVLVDAPKGSSIAVRVGPCQMNYNHDATRERRAVPGLSRVEFQPDDGCTAVDVSVRVGSAPYATLLDCADPAAGGGAESPDGPILLAPLTDDGQGRAVAVFHHPLPDHDVRVVAVDAAGKKHVPISDRTGSDGGMNELTVVFDVAPAQIRRVRLEARALDRWVHFRNVTLDPSRPSAFNILHGDDPTTQPGR